MSNEDIFPEGDAPQDNTGKILGISIGVIVGIGVVCLAIPLCTIVILALLGPSIGNVFSDIILGL